MTQKTHKVGGRTIYGTDQDFRKSSAEKLSVAYDEEIERHRRGLRVTNYKRDINPVRNRFDRMKSYCLKNKIDWRVDWRDYERLWRTAPEVFDPNQGKMVPATEATDRRSGVRATRMDPRDKYVAIDNLVLKQGGQIIYGPLSD